MPIKYQNAYFGEAFLVLLPSNFTQICIREFREEYI